MDKSCKTIALEGMPRSGKTSILKELLKKYSDVLALPEIYFSDQQLKLLKDKRGTLKESKWFINEEVRRKIIVRKNSRNGHVRLICADRMYLSTLAYCYARSKLFNNPGEFLKLVEFFNIKKDKFISYDYIIIFDNSIDVSLSDRRQNREDADAEFWINKRFMHYYNEFYSREVYKYTKAKIIRINAENGTLSQIYNEINIFLKLHNIVLVDDNTIRKEYSAGVLIVRLFGGTKKILLVEHKDNTYVFVKGHIENDETPQDAAIREVREEMGIDLQRANLEYLGVISRISNKANGDSCYKDITMYLTYYEGDESVSGEEVGFWYTIEEALNVLRYEEDKKFLKRVKI